MLFKKKRVCEVNVTKESGLNVYGFVRRYFMNNACVMQKNKYGDESVTIKFVTYSTSKRIAEDLRNTFKELDVTVGSNLILVREKAES